MRLGVVAVDVNVFARDGGRQLQAARARWRIGEEARRLCLVALAAGDSVTLAVSLGLRSGGASTGSRLRTKRSARASSRSGGA